MSIASKPPAAFLVFALRPCHVLDNVIRQTKSNTQAIAGEQVYLAHPPHLTLYVAAFEQREYVAERCRELIAQWHPPKIEVRGWHHFAGDVLTGQQTLVCKLDEPSQARLRDYQGQLIQGLSGYRDVPASLARYRPHFDSLSPQRQRAVQSVGFPFIEDDWIPHFTIASIASSHWPAVWQAVKDSPPSGEFTCVRLSIFRLVDDFPQSWQDIALGDSQQHAGES